MTRLLQQQPKSKLPKFSSSTGSTCLCLLSRQHGGAHAPVPPPPHLLPPAVLHLLLLRPRGQPPLPLPSRQRRLPHQAVAQHERPVRGGGPAQEAEPAEEQEPQREHQLLQRRHGERRGRGRKTQNLKFFFIVYMLHLISAFFGP